MKYVKVIKTNSNVLGCIGEVMSSHWVGGVLYAKVVFPEWSNAIGQFACNDLELVSQSEAWNHYREKDLLEYST